MQRSSLGAGRLARAGLAIAAAALAAGPVAAELGKLRLHTIDIVETPAGGAVEKKGTEARSAPPFDAALVDGGAPGAPVLRKLRLKVSGSTTVNQSCGGCSFVFLRDGYAEGPGPFAETAPKPAAFTGTGSLAGGSSVAWGVVTGWQASGGLFCRADPPSACAFFGRTHDTTVDPFLFSDFYDLGTWFFHATGFTGTPFVHHFLPGSGNDQRWIRGAFSDAAVPALPLAGVALLAGSLVLGAAAALRSRRRP